MAQKTVKDLIGGSSFNHAAFLVRTGMMIGAVSFFTDQLGWEEDEKAKVEGSWGTARFVRPKSQPGFRLQLTEENDFSDTPQVLPGTHVGINVFNAAEAANVVVDWAHYAGIHASVEPANAAGTKWFVSIPELFSFQIEFISTGDRDNQ